MRFVPGTDTGSSVSASPSGWSRGKAVLPGGSVVLGSCWPGASLPPGRTAFQRGSVPRSYPSSEALQDTSMLGLPGSKMQPFIVAAASEPAKHGGCNPPLLPDLTISIRIEGPYSPIVPSVHFTFPRTEDLSSPSPTTIRLSPCAENPETLSTSTCHVFSPWEISSTLPTASRGIDFPFPSHPRIRPPAWHAIEL